MATRVRIPDAYLPGLKVLVDSDESALESVLRHLEKAKPALGAAALSDQLTKAAVDGLSAQEIRDLIDMLVGLYIGRDEISMDIPQFLDLVLTAPNWPENRTLPSEKQEKLRKWLDRFLSFDGALLVAAKALSVLLEHERNFQSCRILTDIRPVFPTDRAAAPLSALVTHTLRIAFHHGRGDHGEFFVAMDEADLKALKEQVLRAEEKQRQAGILIGKAGLAAVAME